MTIKKDEPEVHPFFSLKQDDVQTDRQKFLGLESSDTILWLRRGCGPCKSPLNHCVLLDNPKIIERLGLLSQPLFRIKQDDVQMDHLRFLDLESGDTILWLRRGCGPCNFHKTQWLCLAHPPKC